MKRGYLLIATIAILAICSVFVFAACSDDIELEEHGIVVTIDDFAYNGNIATATINAGNDSYELEWFSVSEAGDLTKLDSAPKDPGTYRVRAYIPNTDCEAIVSFTITKAQTVIENLTVTDKDYDGEPIKAATFTTNSDAENITVKYKKDGDGNEWTTELPYEVGSYEVRVDVQETARYTAKTSSAQFFINPAPTFMEIGVNPRVGLLVAYDDTVVGISANNLDGNLIVSSLDVDALVGKDVKVAAKAIVESFNKYGYLEDNPIIIVAAQTESSKNLAQAAAQEKIAELNKTSLVQAYDITKNDIISMIEACTLDYSTQDLAAMSLMDLQVKLANYRVETAGINNYALNVILPYAFEIEMLRAKVAYVKSNYADQLTNELDEIEYYFLAVDPFFNETKDSLLSPASRYVEIMQKMLQIKMKLIEAIANNSAEIDDLQSDYNHLYLDYNQNVKSPLEGDNNGSITNTFGMYVETLTEEFNNAIASLGFNVEYNMNEIRTTAKEAVDAQYSKYFAFNPWTGEGAFVEGTNVYFYQCPQLNKTYVFNSIENMHTTSLYVYILDGIVKKDNITSAKVLEYTRALVGNNHIAMLLNNSEMYTFVVDGDDVYFEFPKGDAVYSYDLKVDGFDAYVVFTTDNNSNKGYMCLGEYDVNNYLNEPVFAAGTWTLTDGTITLVIDDTNDRVRIYFNVDESNISMVCVDGTAVYRGRYYTEEYVEEFILTDDGKAYITSGDVINPATGKYAYSYVGTWAENGNYIIVTISGYHTYQFNKPNDPDIIMIGTIV